MKRRSGTLLITAAILILIKSNRLGFHVPPFNSVYHLHMHVIGLPFKNKFRYLKYKVGLPWFMDINALFMSLKSELWFCSLSLSLIAKVIVINLLYTLLVQAKVTVNIKEYCIYQWQREKRKNNYKSEPFVSDEVYSWYSEGSDCILAIICTTKIQILHSGESWY